MYVFVCSICVCVSAWVYACMCMKVRWQLWHAYIDSGHWTPVPRLGSKCFYQVSHLASPQLIFILSILLMFSKCDFISTHWLHKLMGLITLQKWSLILTVKLDQLNFKMLWFYVRHKEYKMKFLLPMSGDKLLGWPLVNAMRCCSQYFPLHCLELLVSDR